MGVPRVWAIKRDHGAPLGKRGTHGDGLVVACVGVLVIVGASVVVSVATTAATTADYPDDKVTLPPATTGRPVRTQATQGSPRVRGA